MRAAKPGDSWWHHPNAPSLALLERAAARLAEALLARQVFVGGAVAGMLIMDPAMPEIRATRDMDVICRWCADDHVFDLMPTQGEIPACLPPTGSGQPATTAGCAGDAARHRRPVQPMKARTCPKVMDTVP